MVNAQDTQDTTSNQYRTETPSQTMPGDQSQNQDALGQNQDRERIQSTELPDGVKRSLEGQEYRGWLVNGAFKATGASDASSSSSSMESDTTSTDAGQTQGNTSAVGAQAEEVYIVELKNGAQTKTVRFDKEGKKMEGMDDGMEGQEGMQGQNGQSTPNGETSPENQNNQNESTDPNQSSETQTESTDPNQSSETQTESANPNQSSQNKSTQPHQSSKTKGNSSSTESSSTTTEKNPQ